MSPERVFQILLFFGLTAGGYLYGQYWKKSITLTTSSGEADSLRAQNAELTQQVDSLEGDLAQLRSILASGPYPIPDDLITWIEKDYDMVYLQTPNVRLGTPASFRDVAERNQLHLIGQDALEAENQAWELLGLLPPGQNLLAQLMTVEAAGTKGIYDFENHQILLAQDFDPLSVPDRSVLVKLLALQLSLQNYPEKSWQNRDQWQAWQAVHLGSAAAVQSRFLRRNADTRDEESQDPEPLREALLNELQPSIQGLSNFPYLDGANYSRFFYIDSRAAWARMFREIPPSTAQIMHPEKNLPSPTALTLPTADTPLVATNKIGALGLQLLLEQHGRFLEAPALAQSWRNDQWALRENSLTWLLELDTPHAAQLLAAEFETYLLPTLRNQHPNRQLNLQLHENTLTFTNSLKQP